MLLFDLMTSMLPSLFTWARIGTLDLSAVKLARLLD
jgi:hypothetical protein